MKKVKYCLLIYILLFEIIYGWLLNFDIVPNSISEKNDISLENCRLNYWTQHNTECMDGCSMLGELRYGPNYLSSNALQELPNSIGINCRIQSFGTLFGKKLQKEDYWIKMDVCTSMIQSLADFVITELKYDSRKFFENSIPINNNKNMINSAYIGAYHMNSIGNIIRYKYTFYKYVKYSLIIDLILICLFVINSLIYKYRLVKINRIREQCKTSMKQADK
ncbi:hypothetical protein [Cryptosporidium parvum Iowa II]|uniref:Uncharacterized protein n=2 Tax=Cryptosporidium parvum TaxID=5807 RepID=Q5CZ20_CRYPI|nr:hypothetical protein [Cryptosporidium parvum Iowa II]EAK90514.1 hypothetical protein with signal peptide and transmembrane domain near C-terminus [Cryptosporidium parvum Iowa II]QOY40327.1 Uncharacterized protein CPATCC_0005880 [Cryptosporidium parvum]WKS78693.1 putative signal peptide and transmembrane domain-containing protein [Cryptosporidium sp. 43IA8]WRK33180.1 Uncharacterized protein cpbgf_700155 [Cryptosporidium parvum]|eukprot:QOY40327.1 hypothetical protein CPATCC_003158 [Cryptosporidium parvum]